MSIYSDIKPRVASASGKIFDITHNDVLEHSVALPAGYPVNTKALSIRADRVAGTGVFRPRSTSGVIGYSLSSGTHAVWHRATDGLFYYALSVANDDWDIQCYGYWEG